MLDTRLSLELKPPPFAASYLEHRVIQEPEDGNSMLVYIRRVAQRLAIEQEPTPRCIASLCTLAAQNIRVVFSSTEQPGEAITQEDFDHHSQAAAVYLNRLSIESLEETEVEPAIFGSCFELAFRFGSLRMIEKHLKDPYGRKRVFGFSRASRHGRGIAIVQYSFNYSVDDWTGHFDREVANFEYVQLGHAMKTPDPDTWEYVLDLHRRFNIETRPSRHTYHLLICARKGWTKMARRLLDYGTNPNGSESPETEHPTCAAASGGHGDMVQLLIDRGAKIPPDATKAAASYGHLEIARLLLSHDAHIEGALVAAARSGYGDTVRLLLEHRANPNEEHAGLPAMGYAILAEHATMIKDLREYGARPLTDAERMICLEEAKKAGMDVRFDL
jgi:hypothetical protein